MNIVKLPKYSLKISETGIVKMCVFLMCISSILQSSLIFGSWNILIDGCKYLIPILGAFTLILKLMQSAQINIWTFVVECAISVFVIITCLRTGDYSYLLVCIIILLSRKLSIDVFIGISYKTLIVGGAYI